MSTSCIIIGCRTSIVPMPFPAGAAFSETRCMLMVTSAASATSPTTFIRHRPIATRALAFR